MKEITQVWSKLANIKSSLANSKMSRCDEIFRLKRAYVLCLTINNCRTSKACTECCGPEFLKPVTKSITDWYTYNSSPFQDKLFMCLEWINQSQSINQSFKTVKKLLCTFNFGTHDWLKRCSSVDFHLSLFLRIITGFNFLALSPIKGTRVYSVFWNNS